MPHPIIEIRELTQIIADHCLCDTKWSLVSLACTCRALEEQALSTLWSEQSELEILIESTLPPGILSDSKPLPQPTNAQWGRFRRYAAWMRRLDLDLDSNISAEVLRLLSLGSSGEAVCPGLRDLEWNASPFALPFYRLLFSPELTSFSFTYHSMPFADVPEELLILQTMVTGLDTLPLRRLFLRWYIPQEARRQMEPFASSAVLRCGPALEKLGILSPLSDAAIEHLMQLPNLTIWYAANGPPQPCNLQLPDTFPRLEQLGLGEEASLEWLRFLTKNATRGIPSGQNSHPPSSYAPIPELDALSTFVKAHIDAAFISPIMLFRELTSLRLESACSTLGGCAFSLTDDDIAKIAAALPRLGQLVLGRVCPENSCRTTVASLVSLSTGCRDLEYLEVHFNTANLRRDLESVSADPRLEMLRSLRTCGVFRLSLSSAPITMEGDDVGPVLQGLHRIFPSLTEISGDDMSWVNKRPREI